MHYARGSKHKLFRTMRSLKETLTSAARALTSTKGYDKQYLVRGLASHRVLTAQCKRLRELKRAPSIDSKSGHLSVALGATASILVAFECMALDSRDVDALAPQLTACLRDAHAALVSWRLIGETDEDTACAMSAEIRALERARVAVARAQDISHEYTSVRSIRMQLDFYRRAAWPTGEKLNEESYSDLLERITSGELVDTEPDCLLPSPHEAAPHVVPLSALPSLEEGRRPGSSVLSESDGTVSSIGSFVSSVESDSSTPYNVPLFVPSLVQMQASLGDQLLSDAARMVVAPRNPCTSL